MTQCNLMFSILFSKQRRLNGKPKKRRRKPNDFVDSEPELDDFPLEMILSSGSQFVATSESEMETDSETSEEEERSDSDSSIDIGTLLIIEFLIFTFFSKNKQTKKQQQQQNLHQGKENLGAAEKGRE